MAYEKQTWQTGETITQEKLNHMEDGIENAYELPAVTETDNGKVLGVENGAWSVVNGGGGGGNGYFVVETTRPMGQFGGFTTARADIEQAIKEGKQLVCRDGYYSVFGGSYTYKFDNEDDMNLVELTFFGSGYENTQSNVYTVEYLSARWDGETQTYKDKMLYLPQFVPQASGN